MSYLPRRMAALGLAVAIAANVAACEGRGQDDDAAGFTAVHGRVHVDGSSTLYPLTSAMAEAFNGEGHKVRFRIGAAGSGVGLPAFCAGELDIADASRRMNGEERAACAEADVGFAEIRVGTDALTVIANPDVGFTDCLSERQLAKIWGADADGKITSWRQVSRRFPARPLNLVGPGPESGSFDYFVETVVGPEGSARHDYSAHATDEDIVATVASTPHALGYVGYTYFDTYRAQLKALEVKGDAGCVAPSAQSASDGSYPLSRPLFLYVNHHAYDNKPAVAAFVDYYVDRLPVLAPANRYIPLTSAQQQAAETAVAGLG